MKLSTFTTSVVAAATAVGVYALPAQHHPSETGGLLKPSNPTHGQPEDTQTLSRRYATIPVYAPCPEFNKGSFDIKYPKLYPTSAAWDFANCVLLVGSQVEPKVIVYDPYNEHILREIEIPGLGPKTDYQISSIHWDMYTARWTFLATRRSMDELRDTEEAGNIIIAGYDIFKNEFIWTLDLEASMEHGPYHMAKWGGFHGLEVDHLGQVYFAGTYQATDHWGNPLRSTGIIFRLYRGTTSPLPFIWFLGTSGKGVNIRGLVAVPGSYRLLTHSTDTGYLGEFDMGTEDNDVVPDWLTSDCLSANVKISDIQTMTLPPKYMDNVMLLTSPTKGVQIVQSFRWKWQDDDWLNHRHAYQHTFAVIPPNFAMKAENGFPYDTVQVGNNSVFVMFGYKNAHKARGRDEETWHFEDITKAVEDSLRIKVRDGAEGVPTDWEDPEIWPDADQMYGRAKLQEGWHLSQEWKWMGCGDQS